MKKIIILLLVLTVAAPSFSAMKTFTPQEQIKASDVNHNFNEVEGLLLLKNTNVSFTEFQSGTVIRKENFETEFDKVRNLGVSVDSLSSNSIISEELNNIFAQIIAGVQSYDDPPLASDSNFSVNEDENHLITFNYINNVGPSIIQIFQ